MKTYKQFLDEIFSKTSAVVIHTPSKTGAMVLDSKKPIIKELPVKKMMLNEPAWRKIKSSPESLTKRRKFVSKLKAGTADEIPPIKVFKMPDTNGKYLLVDGHHRWAAHFDAGLRTIRAEIVDPKRVDFAFDDDEVDQMIANHAKNAANRKIELEKSEDENFGV